MVPQIDGVSPRIAKAAQFIETVLCTWIHNPILNSTAMVAGAALLMSKLLMTAASVDQFVHVNFDEYLLDFLHNVVNLLFIVRFPAFSKNGLSIKSSSWSEALLLVVQNCGCAMLLLCPNYSLLYSNIDPLLKGFILWQIVCPYLILIMHLCEAKFPRANSEKSPSESRFLLNSLLVDTNNNLLPVFMAHSFAAVNFNFPFANSFWLLQGYKFACFSLKFYLINRYVLYELVMVICDVSNLKSYKELYEPVMIGEKPKSWSSCIARIAPVVLTTCCVICLGLDAGFMTIAFLK